MLYLKQEDNSFSFGMFPRSIAKVNIIDSIYLSSSILYLFHLSSLDILICSLFLYYYYHVGDKPTLLHQIYCDCDIRVIKFSPSNSEYKFVTCGGVLAGSNLSNSNNSYGSTNKLTTHKGISQSTANSDSNSNSNNHSNNNNNKKKNITTTTTNTHIPYTNHPVTLNNHNHSITNNNNNNTSGNLLNTLR